MRDIQLYRGDCSRRSRTYRDVETVSAGPRFPRSVLEFASVTKNDGHPTQKPLDLVEWLIRTYSNPGDRVLDCFMGSGTTGVACVLNGRKFTGIEKANDYFEIAERRITRGKENRAQSG